MDDKKLLITFDEEFKANVLQTKLQEESIPSWILNKRDRSYLIIGNVEVYVLEKDIDKAKTLLSSEDQ